jgi:hypothetical protein
MFLRSLARRIESSASIMSRCQYYSTRQKTSSNTEWNLLPQAALETLQGSFPSNWRVAQCNEACIQNNRTPDTSMKWKTSGTDAKVQTRLPTKLYYANKQSSIRSKKYETINTKLKKNTHKTRYNIAQFSELYGLLCNYSYVNDFPNFFADCWQGLLQQ